MRTEPFVRPPPRPSPADILPFVHQGNGAAIEKNWLDNGGSREEIEKLLESYNRLPADRYLSPERPYRYRRFGRFLYAGAGTRLRTLPNAPFTQSAEYNPVAGGIARHFEPLSREVLQSRFLDALIGHLIRCLPVVAASWRINVHQFRVVSLGGPVSPAPEGVHRDGHAFIALVAIERANISGGNNSVFDQNMKLLRTVNLHSRFDYLLLDDHRLYHGVSPVVSRERSRGYRDMLIIDFNFEDR